MNIIEQLTEHLAVSKIDPELLQEPVACVMSGPKETIEVVVRLASLKSGIPMDWGYAAGRAIVHAKGDCKAARRALYEVIPQSDLTQADL